MGELEYERKETRHMLCCALEETPVEGTGGPQVSKHIVITKIYIFQLCSITELP